MKKNNDLISIIVPIYKSENFINKCVDSILNQTYNNIELILVDDGSPDNSGKICDEYSKKDSRVVVIHKKNGGTCEARNEGLKKVTGKYLMFVDGDDWLSSDCVEYLYNLLIKNNAEMSMSDSVFTTRNLNQNKEDKIRILTPEEATCEILYVKTPVGPWNKLYSMSVIKKYNLSFSVKWFGEGLYFSAMNAQLSKKIAYGHKKVYIYRKNNPNSGTTIKNVQNGLNALDNIKYIKNNLVIKTTNTIAAANWHIWKNNFNLICYIIGAHAKKEYLDEYKNSKKELRKNCLSVLIKSKIGIKKKIEVVGLSIFPVTASICANNIRKYLYNKDYNRENK